MVASAIDVGLPPTGSIQLSGGYTADFCRIGVGEPVVLVPGLAGGIDLLTPLIRELAHRHCVIAYELRGERGGFFDRGFGFRQHVDDLHGVVQNLGLERPGLVGVSFGGALAIEYAIHNSGRIGFLAVQGVGRRFHRGLMGQVAQQVLNRLPLPHKSPFISQFLKVLMGQNACHRESEFDFVVERCWQTDQSVVADRLDLLFDYDPQDRLKQVAVPTLVLSGLDDVVVSPKQARDLASALPNGHYESIPGAGHLACVTSPCQVTHEIERFAASTRAAA